MKNFLLTLIIAAFAIGAEAKITVPKNNPQAEYAAQRLSSISDKGYNFKIIITTKEKNPECAENEAFILKRKGKTISIISSGSGCIYGVNRLLEYYRDNGNLDIPETMTDAPEMKLRGACLGVQKVGYLPGRKVYEYPYTKESFPWFYDKSLWIN
mgnify:FL=1